MSILITEVFNFLGIGGAGCISGVSQNEDGTGILGKRKIQHLPEKIASNLKAEVLVLGNCYSAAMAVKDLATGIMGLFATIFTGSYAYKKSETVRTWTHNISKVLSDVFQSIPLAGNWYAAWRNKSSTEEAAQSVFRNIDKNKINSISEEDLKNCVIAYLQENPLSDTSKALLEFAVERIREKFTNLNLLEEILSAVPSPVDTNSSIFGFRKKINDKIDHLKSIELSIQKSLALSIDEMREKELYIDTMSEENLKNWVIYYLKETPLLDASKPILQSAVDRIKGEKFTNLKLLEEILSAVPSPVDTNGPTFGFATEITNKVADLKLQLSIQDNLIKKAKNASVVEIVSVMSLENILDELPLIADFYKNHGEPVEGKLIEECMLKKLEEMLRNKPNEYINNLNNLQRKVKSQPQTNLQLLNLINTEISEHYVKQNAEADKAAQVKAKAENLLKAEKAYQDLEQHKKTTRPNNILFFSDNGTKWDQTLQDLKNKYNELEKALIRKLNDEELNDIIDLAGIYKKLIFSEEAINAVLPERHPEALPINLEY